MNALSASDILTKDEVRLVLDHFQRILGGRKNANRPRKNTKQNQVIFCLATCCGLRVSEIANLTMRMITTAGPRPAIQLPKGIVKGRTRMRTVPLWWDEQNRTVIESWVAFRVSQGAEQDSPVVCRQMAGKRFGERCPRNFVANRWKTAIRVLGKERVRQLSIHCGRHTFASHALNVGRSLVEVQTALGHSTLSTTAIYAHLIERDNIPDLYGVTK